MRDPKRMTHADLAAIVRQIQEMLYAEFDDEGRIVDWDLDKEINGADFVDAVSGILNDFNLTPSGTFSSEERDENKPSDAYGKGQYLRAAIEGIVTSDHPLATRLTDAALAHEAETEPGMASGDLELVLRVAFDVMTTDQIAAVFENPDVDELGKVPEYRDLWIALGLTVPKSLYQVALYWRDESDSGVMHPIGTVDLTASSDDEAIRRGEDAAQALVDEPVAVEIIGVRSIPEANEDQ